jgi:PhnB protein
MISTAGARAHRVHPVKHQSAQEEPMQLNPYLFFNGRCEEAFTFYARVLGGKIVAMMRHAGTPAAEHTPPEWLDKIIHARLNVDGVFLMGSDAPPGRYEESQGYTVTLGIPVPADAERVFNALAKGGTVRMPLEETFWAARFGMLVDQFGIPWMINCEKAA